MKTTAMASLKRITSAQMEAEHQALLRAFVYDAEGNTLTLHIRYPYEVDLDTIQTHSDLLGRIHHLSMKAWMTNVHLHFFIQRVCEIKGWNIYR
ncbi:MAG: hypothetical protein BWY09_01668 [Candidatus Hydrogenedentes bacterium ADurb.Bin179]|nr:MAG: hypothetical protein BWY09_01668 [Candidatus Hydrogenedentes bacterium ADurb.Bin179]